MTLMTELYEQSGPDSIASGTDYSDSSKNVEPVYGAAYSVLGESTPDTFYNALTPSMMENGFLSRWTAIECERTNKPNLQPDADEEPGEELLNVVGCMLHFCLQQRTKPLHLECDAEAADLLEDFRIACDEEVNAAGTDHARRAAWNRSHMKAFRVAGLVACADYYKKLHDWFSGGQVNERPQAQIRLAHIEWAIDVEVRNARAITSRLATGSVGTGDGAGARRVRASL